MRHVSFLVVSLMFAMALVARSAEGEVVTWEFTGTLDFVHDFDNVFAGSVLKGDSFSGFVVFEDTTSDSDPDSGVGRYIDAILDVEVLIGSSFFGGPNAFSENLVTLRDNATSTGLTDQYSFRARLLYDSIVTVFSLSGILKSTALASDELSQLPIRIDPNGSSALTLTSEDPGRSFSLRGDITSIQIVPEPGTLGLLAGFLAVGSLFRHRG